MNVPLAIALVVSWLLVAPPGDAALGLGVATPGIGSATIASITLSAGSFQANSVSGTTVGTISVGMSSGSFVGSLALTGDPDDAGCFTLSGSTVSVSGNLCPGRAYLLTVTATQAGISNSPFSQQIEVDAISTGCPAGYVCRYADYTNGVDTNAGTTEGSPWKHAPGMTGCSNNCSSYSVVAGSAIVFRGGITWPVAALPLNASVSGSSAKQVLYTVDTTWFAGSNSGTVNTYNCSGIGVSTGSGGATGVPCPGVGYYVQWVPPTPGNVNNSFDVDGSWACGAITINSVSYTIAAQKSWRNPFMIKLISLSSECGGGKTVVNPGNQTNVAYSNSLFVRPVLDLSHNGFIQVHLTSGVSYITIDDLEFTGAMIDGAFGCCAAVKVDNPTNGNIVIANAYMHNWGACAGSGTPYSGCTVNLAAGDYVSNGGGGPTLGTSGSYANTYLVNSNIGDPDNNANGGADLSDSGGTVPRSPSVCMFNYMHDASYGSDHNCQYFHDNVTDNIGTALGTSHPDVTYLDNFCGASGGSCGSSVVSYVYNNWILDTSGTSGNTQIYPNPGSANVSSGTIKYYVYNNVITCYALGAGCVSGTGDHGDDASATASMTYGLHDWSNTYQVSAGNAGSFSCVAIITRAAGTVVWDTFDTTNNYCINGASNTSGSATNINDTAPLLQTAAVANGQLVYAPTWYPTAGTGGTIGAGTNLTSNCSGNLYALCFTASLGGTATPSARPTSGAWNIGAY